jgi:hypothetical protein
LSLPIKSNDCLYSPGGIRLAWLKDQYVEENNPSAADFAVISMSGEEGLKTRLNEAATIGSTCGVKASERFAHLLVRHIPESSDQKILSLLHECISDDRLDSFADLLESMS